MLDRMNCIAIPADEYEELKKDSLTLLALMEAGVDNWEGYDYAMQLYEERTDAS